MEGCDKNTKFCCSWPHGYTLQSVGGFVFGVLIRTSSVPSSFHKARRAVPGLRHNRCGYKRRGSLHLAATDQEQQELDEGTPQLVKDGFGAELVERSQLARGGRSKTFDPHTPCVVPFENPREC